MGTVFPTPPFCSAISPRRGSTSQLAINMSSKEQKPEQVVAEEEVDAKKDAVKGTKRPAEDKNDDIKKLKKAEENGDDEDVEDEEEAEEEEEDLPEGEEDFDEEGEGRVKVTMMMTERVKK